MTLHSHVLGEIYLPQWVQMDLSECSISGNGCGLMIIIMVIMHFYV